MKKVLLSLAAVSAIATAASPAAADVRIGYGHGYDRGIGREINDREAFVSQRIEQAIRRGLVSRQDAWSLTTELRNFKAVERQYRYGGLSRAEVANLDYRLSKLEFKLRSSMQDGRAYGYGYGRW